MNQNLLFFLLSASLIALGCKKEKKGTTSTGCSLSPTTILGTYKLTGYTIQQTAASPVVDDYATWQTCEKDDQLTLSGDGMYKRVDVGILCSSPGDVITGTWSLNGNAFTNDGMPSTVVTFDCHTLEISTDAYPKETGTYYK